MSKLETQRDKKLVRLLELGPQVLVGTASETYRTCGNPGCRCHSMGPKHGPHLYVSYPGKHGRTTGYYVPVALHERVRQGLAAWKELRTLARDIAELNKEIMNAERPHKTRRRRGGGT